MNDTPSPPPEVNPELPPTPDWGVLLATLVAGGIYAALLYRAPFLGHDWYHFSWGVFDIQYPPWMSLLWKPLAVLPPRLGLAIVNGLTVSAVTMLSYRYARHTFPNSRQPAILAALFAIVNPMPWMLLWLGQIEMFVLIGLMILPVGIPFLFAKPHMAPWVVVGSRRDIIWTVIILLLSLVIWPGWPRDLLELSLEVRMIHPMAMGWLSTHPLMGVLGAVMLLFTTRDPLRLMAAGAFISPFFMPYHYYMLLPALGRTRGYRQMALWITSLFTIFVAGFYTITFKFLAMTFPILVWLLLAPTLKPREILADPDIIINRMFATVRETIGWLRDRLPGRQEAKSSE